MTKDELIYNIAVWRCINFKGGGQWYIFPLLSIMRDWIKFYLILSWVRELYDGWLSCTVRRELGLCLFTLFISTTVSANSNKTIFGYTQCSPFYELPRLFELPRITQRTIFGKFYSIISFIISLLLLNNPQITKTLSENVLAKLKIIKYLLAGIASNDYPWKFRKFTLNNSNNFFNSLKKNKMNANKLHVKHIHTNTHSFSLSSLNTKFFSSGLQCNKNKLHPYYVTGFVDAEGCFSIDGKTQTK